MIQVNIIVVTPATLLVHIIITIIQVIIIQVVVVHRPADVLDVEEREAVKHVVEQAV